MKPIFLLTMIFVLFITTWNVNTDSMPVLAGLTAVFILLFIYVMRVLKRMLASSEH